MVHQIWFQELNPSVVNPGSTGTGLGEHAVEIVSQKQRFKAVHLTLVSSAASAESKGCQPGFNLLRHPAKVRMMRYPMTPFPAAAAASSNRMPASRTRPVHNSAYLGVGDSCKKG